MIDREKLVDDLLRDLNEIRSTPASYVAFLEERREHHQYNCILAGGHVIKSLEGLQPLDELIHDMGMPVSMSPLKWSYALHTVADIFSHELGTNGTAGHFNTKGKGLKERLAEHCLVRGKVVELIQISGTNSKQILTEMLVDDGLATRKRRRNLLDPDYNFIGVGVAPHSQFGYITVMILAHEVLEGADLANHKAISNMAVVPHLAVSLPQRINMPSGGPIAIRHDQIHSLAAVNQYQREPEANRCNIC